MRLAASPYQNGGYATRAEVSGVRAELLTHVEDIKGDVGEIKSDMKDVLAFVNAVKGVFRTVIQASVILGGLGGFGYLIAYLFIGN